MYKYKVTTLNALALLIFSGCGGGSSSVSTGIGYYIDSAVEGLKYTCGSQSGETDQDGKFIFEAGQDCSFYLGSTKIDEIKKEELKDKEKLLADESVVSLLQTLDNDGNAENGILIKKEVVEAIKASLQNALPKTDTQMKILHEELLQKNISGYDGQYISTIIAKKHLDGTNIKNQLAGKTFYKPLESGHSKKFEFNADATLLTRTPDNTEAYSNKIEIKENYLLIYYDNMPSESINITEQTDKYILLGDYKLFFNKEDALTESRKLVESNTTTSESTILSSLISGKTLYDYSTCEGSFFMTESTFGNDGKIQYKENGVIDTAFYDFYHISNDTLFIKEYNGVGDNPFQISEITDTYISFTDKMGTLSKFYFNEVDAKSSTPYECTD